MGTVKAKDYTIRTKSLVGVSQVELNEVDSEYRLTILLEGVGMVELFYPEADKDTADNDRSRFMQALERNSEA